MQKILISTLIGSLFGLGIILSGMANPAKVLNFFDVAGNWDPSLIFVMGGAFLTTALGYRLVLGRYQKPAFDEKFHLPARKAINARLILGAAIFGVGWGIAGFCPGGALPALGFGGVGALGFVGAMVLGIALARSLESLYVNSASAIQFGRQKNVQLSSQDVG